MTAFALLGFFVEILAKLFSIVNPLGAVPMYLTMTANYSVAERKKLVFHTSIYFICILMAFFWGGSLILGFFGLTVNALRIAGGLIILNSGFALLNDRFAQSRAMSPEVQKEAMDKPDISFSPLAMPMLSGPGSISLLIGFYAEYTLVQERLMVSLVILVVGLLAYIVLLMAPYFYKILGVSGLKAGSRIMSFITMAIGVQFILKGIVDQVMLLLKH
jgi:multiple antibiotic resistance protein